MMTGRLRSDGRGRRSRAVYTIRGHARAISRNLQISNQFRAVFRLTLSKTGTYTHTDDAATRASPPAARRSRARGRVRRAPLAAQAIQKSLYVSVVDAAGAAGARPRPAGLRRHAKTTSRARCCASPPADEPMQIALLVDNSQAARSRTSRDMRAALPPFVTTLDDRTTRGASNEVALIAFGERPTILTDYTTRSGAAAARAIDRIFAQPGSGAYLARRRSSRSSRAFKKREAPRPVIVAITTEGPRAQRSRSIDHVLEPLRDAGAALYALMLGAPSDRHPTRRATATWCSTRARVDDRRPAATQLLRRARRCARQLKQLADELTHQYRVTYARPQSLIPPERVTVSRGEARLTARGTLAKEPQERAVTRPLPLRSPIVLAVRRRSLQLVVAPAPRRRQPPPRRRRQPPVAASRPQVAAFRAGVELVSLNVTVTDGTQHYITDLDAGGLQRLRGRRQAGRHVLQPHQPADRAGAAARHQRQHGHASCRRRRKRRSASRASCGRRISPRSSTSTAASSSCRTSPTTRSELEQAIRKTSAGGSTSLYNAIYIALKDLKKVVAKNVDEIRRQAIVVLSDGEDTSSLLPFEEVLDLAKRSETAIYAIGLRSTEGTAPAQGLQGSGVRAAPARRRKPAAARSSRTRSPS